MQVFEIVKVNEMYFKYNFVYFFVKIKWNLIFLEKLYVPKCIIRAAVHLTLRMLQSIRLINQKIEFYKSTNQKMLRSIRSAKWTAA